MRHESYVARQDKFIIRFNEQVRIRKKNFKIQLFCNKNSSLLYICTWRSGYCYLNKAECNLNQSKDDSFVEQVAKNNS